MPALNPFQPGVETFRMRLQGQPLSSVALDPLWWGHSAASTWATFGLMNVRPPVWAYGLAAAVWIGLALCSVDGFRELARTGNRRRLAELALLAAGLGLWLAASLLHSWTEDWQPQGRYLLPGILALGVLMAGVPVSDTRTHRVRQILLAAHVVLGVIVAATLPFAVPAP